MKGVAHVKMVLAGPVFFAGKCSVWVSLIYTCRVESTVMYSAYMQVKLSNICVC
jgi:hypothetical protein